MARLTPAFHTILFNAAILLFSLILPTRSFADTVLQRDMLHRACQTGGAQGLLTVHL